MKQPSAAFWGVLLAGLCILAGGAGAVEEAPAPGIPGFQEVESFLRRWLFTQNHRDFAGYSALYAERMLGVRHSGPRTRRFDRVGWLYDRKHSFANPVQVKAAETAVVPAGGEFILTFRETWSSGEYENVGAKELVLAREKGGLKIVREERIPSHPLFPAKPLGEAADNFYFTLSAPGRTYVILDALVKTPGEAGGTLEWVDAGEADWVAVKREPDPAAGAGAFQKWRDQKVWLAGKGNVLGAVPVDHAVFLSLQIPHFGVRESWKLLPDDARNREAWKSGAVFLAVEISRASGSEAPVWAYRTLSPLPRILPFGLVDDATQNELLARVRQSPTYAEIQREFNLKAAREWANRPWELYRQSVPAVLATREGDDGPGLAAVALNAETGCEGLGGNLFSVFLREPGKPFALQSQLFENVTSILAVLDLDHDGSPEILAAVGDNVWVLIGLKNQDFKIIKRWVIPDRNCPC